MQPRQRFDFVMMASLLVGFSGLSLSLLSALHKEPQSFTIAAVVLFVVLGTVLVFYLIYMTRRFPTSLSIALVGPPGAGKTVFLTVLFRELQTGRLGPLLFAPSGKFTTEEVERNIGLMASGHFPSRTPLDVATTYEAVARLGNMLPREYRIRITDFAGEHLYQSFEGHWLHEGEFFDRLVSSDAILFMIDCETLLNAADDIVARVESGLIAALNLIIEKRNENPTRLLHIPVGLLLSKADVVWDRELPRASITERIAGFLAIADRRCARFRVFFVSSLGREPEPENTPPRRISPQGIIEPIRWLLRG